MGRRLILGILITMLLLAGCARTTDTTTPEGQPTDSAPLVWARQFEYVRYGTDQACSVAVDEAGNIYVGGAFNGGVNPGGRGIGFIRKYDATGVEVWTRVFETDTQVSFGETLDVAVDKAGNVYVCGYTREGDAFLRKYDSSGTELWTRQYGSRSDDMAWSVAVDQSGNAYMAGRIWVPYPGYEISGNDDAFLIKYDASGNEQWDRQFGYHGTEPISDEREHPRIDEAYSIAVDEYGSIYVSGWTYGAPSYELVKHAFLRKFDPAGTELWVREFSQAVIHSVVADSQGNIYAVGWTEDAQGKAALLRKYDSFGTELWTRQFGADWAHVAWGVALDSVGHVYVAGFGYGVRGDRQTSFVRKYSATGEELWSFQFGVEPSEFAYFYDITADNKENAFIVGTTFNPLPGNTMEGTTTDAFVMKLNTNIK
jgi:hypothetical protein